MSKSSTYHCLNANLFDKSQLCWGDGCLPVFRLSGNTLPQHDSKWSKNWISSFKKLQQLKTLNYKWIWTENTGKIKISLKQQYIASMSRAAGGVNLKLLLTRSFVFSRQRIDSEDQGLLFDILCFWQTTSSPELSLTLSVFYSFSSTHKQEQAQRIKPIPWLLQALPLVLTLQYNNRSQGVTCRPCEE